MSSPDTRLMQRKINEGLLTGAMEVAPLAQQINTKHSSSDPIDPVTINRSMDNELTGIVSEITPKASNSSRVRNEPFSFLSNESSTSNSSSTHSLTSSLEKTETSRENNDTTIAESLSLNSLNQEETVCNFEHQQEETEGIATIENLKFIEYESPESFLENCLTDSNVIKVTYDEHVKMMKKLNELWRDRVSIANVNIDTKSVSSQASVDLMSDCGSVTTIRYLEQEIVLIRQKARLDLVNLRKELEQEKQDALYRQKQQILMMSKEDEIRALREEYEQEATVFMEGIRIEYEDAQGKGIEIALSRQQEELEKVHSNKIDDALTLQELRLKEENEHILANALEDSRMYLQRRHDASLSKVQENLTKQLEEQRNRMLAEREVALENYRRKTEMNTSDMVGDVVAKFLDASKKMAENHNTEVENLKIEHLQQLDDRGEQFQKELASERVKHDSEMEKLRKSLEEGTVVRVSSDSSDNSTSSASSAFRSTTSRSSSRAHFEKLHRLQQQREKALREAIGKINESLEHKNLDEKALLDEKVRQVEELESEAREQESNHRSHIENLVKKFEYEQETLVKQHECEMNELKTTTDAAVAEANDFASKLEEYEKNHRNERKKWTEQHENDVLLIQKSMDDLENKAREIAEAAIVVEKTNIKQKHKDEIDAFQKSIDGMVSRGEEERSDLANSLKSLTTEKEQLVERHKKELSDQQEESDSTISEIRTKNENLKLEIKEISEETSEEKNTLEKELQSASKVAGEALHQLKSLENDFEQAKDELVLKHNKENLVMRLSVDEAKEHLKIDFTSRKEKLLERHKDELIRLRKELHEAVIKERNEKNRHLESKSEFKLVKMELVEQHKLKINELLKTMDRTTTAMSHVDASGDKTSRKINDISIVEICSQTNNNPMQKIPLENSDEEMKLAIESAVLVSEEKLRREFESQRKAMKTGKTDEEVEEAVQKAVNERTERLCNEFQDQLRTALEAKRQANERELEAAIKKATSEITGQNKDGYKCQISELESKLQEAEKVLKEEKYSIESRHFAKLEMFRRSHQAQLKKCEERINSIERTKALEIANMKTEYKTKEVANATNHVQVQEVMRQAIIETNNLEELLNEARKKSAVLEIRLEGHQQIIEKLIVKLSSCEGVAATEVCKALDILHENIESCVSEENVELPKGESKQINSEQIQKHATVSSRKSLEPETAFESVESNENLDETTPRRRGFSERRRRNSFRNQDGLGNYPSCNQTEEECTERDGLQHKVRGNNCEESLVSKNHNLWQDSPSREDVSKGESSSFTVDEINATNRREEPTDRKVVRSKDIVTFLQLPLTPPMSPKTPPMTPKNLSGFITVMNRTGSDETSTTTDETPSPIPPPTLRSYSDGRRKTEFNEIELPKESQSNRSTRICQSRSTLPQSISRSMSQSPYCSTRKHRSISPSSQSMPRSMSESPFRARILQNMRKTTNQNASETRVLLTCPNTPQLVQMLHDLDAILIESIEKAHMTTHIVIGETLRRTPKLMIGLCVTSNVVTTEWLLNSHRNKQILDASKYLCLNDKRAEKRYGFSMKRTLYNGMSHREKGGLLKGWTAVIAKGVAGYRAPSLMELRLILKAAGAKIVSLEEFKSINAKNRGLVVTSDPPTQNQIIYVKNNGAELITTSCLFDCVMHQKINGVKRKI